MSTWAQYKEGQHKFSCDRCGRIRWSERKRIDGYTGGIVCDTCYDPKHPQDYVRARQEDISVENARPLDREDQTWTTAVVTSAVVNSTSTTVTFTFDKPVTMSNAKGWSVFSDITTINIYKITGGGATWIFHFNEKFYANDTIRYSYDADVGDVTDYSQAAVASVASGNVTNNAVFIKAFVFAEVPAITSASTVLNVISRASVAATVGAATSAVTATITRIASVAATVGSVTSSSTSRATRIASVAATVGSATSSVFVFGTTRIASVAATVGSVVSTAVALTTRKKASVAATVGSITSSATVGSLIRHASVDADTGSVTSALSGSLIHPASVDATVPGVTSASTSTTAWYLENFSYTSNSLDVSPEDSNHTDLAFSSDGTKLYVLGDSFNRVFQYTLSSAWDLSTASYSTKSFNWTQDPSMRGVTFKSDGTKMYLIGWVNQEIYQYSLSTAWDVSTASYDSKLLDISSEDTTIEGVFISSDGTKMYMLGNDNNAIFQYALSTPYDVSTGSYASKSFSTEPTEFNPRGFFIRSDGLRAYVIGENNASVYQYELSSAWDISTASYNGVLIDIGSEETFPTGVSFSSDGMKMYVVGYDNDAVFEYST